MPGSKRKYTKRTSTGVRYKRADHYAASKIQAAIRRAINKNIETKMGCRQITDGIEIGHNNFVILSNQPLDTVNGTEDEENAQGQRIGDKINLRGLKISMMVELNERFSDVTFRFLFVKSAKNDTPTRATLFMGNSGNKMIDNLNTERYTILKQKWFKIKAANQGTNGGTPAAGSGLNTATESQQLLSRATRIVKVWIPGQKIIKSGIFTYENNSNQPKFFDYHAILYAYSNYSTNQDVWYVGRLNDMVIQMYYKDA
ncbi:MAG: putative capsid protein [Cressdnaviricota sp.]|nr:MAG: putative capsid protein [Cressdnaviricota sp.]